MLTISIHKPEFLTFSRYGFRHHLKFHRIAALSCATDSKSLYARKKEEVSVQLPAPAIQTSKPSNLKFDRLQPSDHDLIEVNGLQFGRYVAREAVLDEEYWTAAWLRAESHWEDRTNERSLRGDCVHVRSGSSLISGYVDNFKRKFAEQEFNAIKRRCTVQHGQHGQKSACIVTVKKEERNVKRTIIKSVVGTLDLSFRHLLNGESFPGERVKASLFCSINRTESKMYAYVANLCVAKSARRQGIARNMLHFAIGSAKSIGVEKVYVHVHRYNRPAQELYQKMDFQMVDMASTQLSEDQTYLLCLKT